MSVGGFLISRVLGKTTEACKISWKMCPAATEQMVLVIDNLSLDNNLPSDLK